MNRPKKHRGESGAFKKTKPSARTAIALSLLLLCGLGIVAYINSLHVPFVFDDAASVERNPGVRLGDYLSDSLLQMRSLLYITFALNHVVGGMDPWGYHVVNLLLHLINGILVFFIARHIFHKTGVLAPELDWLAGLAAALFLVHPVQTESVTYISSRSELLSTFFYALGFLIFIIWPERKIGFVLAGVVSLVFGLGLISKETVISLPASIVLYDLVFMSRGSPRDVLRHWRFYSVFLIPGLIGCIYLLAQWNRVFKPQPSLLSPWSYFLTQSRVIVRYIGLLLFPVGMNLDYDFRVSASILEPSVLLCLTLLIALLAGAVYCLRNRPVIAFSIVWFFITLAPTSSFAPIQDVIFEHRLYLPLVGVCLLFPLLIRQRIIACSIVAILLIGTAYRNDTWGDDVRLYNDIVSKSPHKARAYNALTLAYAKRGQFDQAVAAAQTGISNVPPADKYELYTILGNLYLQAARYDEAIVAYKNSLGGGDLAVAYNNLGVAYWRQSEQLRTNRSIMTTSDFEVATNHLLSEAQAAFLESYHRDRTNLTSLDSYIQVRHDEGSTDAWQSELQELLAKEESFDTLYSLGKLASLENHFEDAVQYLRRAIHINSDHTVLHFNYAYALAQTGRTNDAIAEYLVAIHHDPTFSEAHFNIALLYLKNADTPNAIANFDEVLRVNPDHLPTLLSLARLFIQQNQPARAKPYLQQALRINPQNLDALNLWHQLGS